MMGAVSSSACTRRGTGAVKAQGSLAGSSRAGRSSARAASPRPQRAAWRGKYFRVAMRERWPDAARLGNQK